MKNYKQKTADVPQAKRIFNPAPVTDYMVPAKKLITFRPDTDIMEVVETLLKYHITGAPVLDEKGALVGLIDDKDCLKVLIDTAYHNQQIGDTSIARYMTNVMKSISHKATIVEVADQFLNTKYKRLLVLDDDKRLVGQISRQDILSAIRDFYDDFV